MPVLTGGTASALLNAAGRADKLHEHITYTVIANDLAQQCFLCALHACGHLVYVPGQAAGSLCAN